MLFTKGCCVIAMIFQNLCHCDFSRGLWQHRRLCEIAAVPMFVVSPYAVAIVVASSQNRAPSW